MSYILHSYRPYSGDFIRSNEPSMNLRPGTRRLRSFLIWVQWSTKETGTLQPSGLLRMFIFGHDMEIKLKSESNSQDQSCFRNKKQLKRKTIENEIGVRALTAYWLKGQTLRKLALQTMYLGKHNSNATREITFATHFCKSNPDPVLARTTPSLAPPIASLCAHLAQSMPL